MEPLFYSTGQVARQLGTTLATIRILCENRVIAAETTPGGHWRVPASEVERLKRDGLPPIRSIRASLPCWTETDGPLRKSPRRGARGRHESRVASRRSRPTKPKPAPATRIGRGLCLALADWSTELRRWQGSQGWATVAPRLAHVGTSGGGLG